MNGDTPAQGSAVEDWTCGLSLVNAQQVQSFRNRLIEVACLREIACGASRLLKKPGPSFQGPPRRGVPE